jgi:hypothetical protein
MRLRGWRAIVALASGVLSAGFVSVDRVEAKEAESVTGADTLRAEALFVAGKALLEQHEYARACPLLRDSFDLDPATGALLALAICFEGQGKLASAAAAYEKVAARAAEEQRTDRVRVARDRGAALQEQASTIAIVPPAEPSLPGGFSIRRDGVPVDAAQFALPLPCDGGEHVIEISASGKKPWRTRIWVAPAGDRQTVNIPALEDASIEGSATAPTLQPAAPTMLATSLNKPAGARPDSAQPLAQISTTAARSEPSRASARLRLSSFALVTASAATLGVGTFYGIRAMQKQKDSQTGCTGNACNPQGKADRLAALSAGNKATIAFIAGGALAATGGALLILGHHLPAVRLGNQATLRGGLAFSPTGAGLVLEGAILR